MAFEVLFDGHTELAHYEVVNTIYAGREARVLYSGGRAAAQSGMALDGEDELLFDYNQRFMELIAGLKPQRILLIGGGACTLPTAVLEKYPDIEIDIVELDAGLIEIAKRYFAFKPTAKTSIFTMGGRQYLDDSHKCYDLILVDAFIHATIPQDLRDLEAVRAYAAHLNPDGVAAINIIASLRGDRSAMLNDMTRSARQVFGEVEIFPASSGFSQWTAQNFVVTMQNGTKDPHKYLKYPPVE